MATIILHCVDADNTTPLEITNLNTSIVRPVDVTYHYGLTRKPAKGKIWKMTRVGRKLVFDQWSTFDVIGVAENTTALFEQV